MSPRVKLRWKPLPRTVRLRAPRYRRCNYCNHTVRLYVDRTLWDHYPWQITPDKLCRGSGTASYGNTVRIIKNEENEMGRSTTKYKYTGKNGSMGFMTGQIYDLQVTEKTKGMPDIIHPNYVPYGSWNAFNNNWDQVK